jgi:hypothetical protein
VRRLRSVLEDEALDDGAVCERFGEGVAGDGLGVALHPRRQQDEGAVGEGGGEQLDVLEEGLTA